MTEKANSKPSRELPEEEVLKAVSRRNFIKSVITSSVAVSSAGYLFRASSLLQGQQLPAGVGERLLTLNVNGQQPMLPPNLAILVDNSGSSFMYCCSKASSGWSIAMPTPSSASSISTQPSASCSSRLSWRESTRDPLARVQQQRTS